MIHIHLNIGSNLGDREDNLRRAVELLRQLAGDVTLVRVSDIVVSPPWGFDSSNEFMNIGMSFDTPLIPEELLAATQRIERTISAVSHRDENGNYIDRIIDIDLIAATTIPTTSDPSTHLITRSTPTLILPHPRARLRDFVLTPLRQIDPNLFKIINK